MGRWDDIVEATGRGLRAWQADLGHAWAALRRPPVAGTALRWQRAAPLAGAVAGLAGGIAFVIAAWLGLVPPLAPVAAVAVVALVTMASGEGGLAASIAALASLGDRLGRADRLGTPQLTPGGVVALVLVLLARVGALAALYHPWAVTSALMAAGVLGGALPALYAAWLPQASSNPAAPPTRGVFLTALLIALVAALLLLGIGPGLLALAVAAVAALLLGGFMRAALGGHADAPSRAARLLVETAVLLALAAL